jgi:DNA primase
MNKQNPDIIRLTPEHLDELRATIDWQALFAGLGLRKAEGKSKPNDWWAYSPFHEEKTPSFHMGPGGIWFDFSIGEGGGALELVQKLQGGNCFEAGRFILEQGWAQASIELSQPVTKTRDSVRRSVTKSVTTCDKADAPVNEAIRQDLITMCGYHDVLAQRGISEATCDALGIGFLPQGRSPLKGRIVFQVADARVKNEEGGMQRVILSHLGRAVSDDAEPKYLFYPGFHKSAELYGQEILLLHEDAKEQMAQTGCIVLTEGPFDVAKAYQAGLRNVVGSFGAALSEQQAIKLKNMVGTLGADTILIAFDRDDAGREGAVKAELRLSQLGIKTRIFDWEASVGRSRKGSVYLPDEIGDLAEFSTEQITWLRGRGLL